MFIVVRLLWLYCKQPCIRLETIMIVVVVAKTCTGLPRINGVMENITANLGDKVGQNTRATINTIKLDIYYPHQYLNIDVYIKYIFFSYPECIFDITPFKEMSHWESNFHIGFSPWCKDTEIQFSKHLHLLK